MNQSSLSQCFLPFVDGADIHHVSTLSQHLFPPLTPSQWLLILIALGKMIASLAAGVGYVT